MKTVFYWVLYPLIRPFYLVFILLNTLALAVLVIVVSMLDRTGNIVHYIGKFWALLNVYASGTRMFIKGKDKIVKGQNYVIMSNHQSLFDVWALIGKMPLQLRWIIKSEIRHVPVFGYALERMGHIFIERKTRSGAVMSLRKASQRIRGGGTVVVFPEGTRSEDGRLQRFQKGGIALAGMAGIPILPVTINGSRFVLPKRTLALMPGKIQIVVGDAIDPSMYKHGNRDALLDTVKAAIEQNLDLKFGKLT